MSAQDKDATPLAKLVSAGEAQTEATRITDTIWMVKDISNAYLVNTGDGDVMVNAGFIGNDAKNKALFDPHRTGPLKRVIFTQSHADHYGALPGQLEDGTQVIGGAGFTETAEYFDRLDDFLKRRSGKLWGSITRGNGPAPVPPKVVPDLEVADVHRFEQGGKRFEVHKTPGGETLDSVYVWLPQEKTVFTGNLFGPVWKAMPNLVTIRGDRPRLARAYLQSVEEVLALEPELVVTGHGEPIGGAAQIRADLELMHAAVSWLVDQTVAGMNAGKTVHQLMQEIALPEALTIGQFHGKTSWVVRAIWEENGGWFHYADGTTALYGSPRSSVDADLVELAGGADALAGKARARIEAGEPVEALHFIDIALHAEPANKAALSAKKIALEHLLAEHGGTNLSETMWLKSEVAETEKTLG